MTLSVSQWPFDFSLFRALQSCRRHIWQRQRHWELCSDLVTQLTIPGKSRNSNHDIALIDREWPGQHLQFLRFFATWERTPAFLPQFNPHFVIPIRLMGQKILLIITTAILTTCTATMATYYFFFPPLTSRAIEVVEMRGENLIYGEVWNSILKCGNTNNQPCLRMAAPCSTSPSPSLSSSSSPLALASALTLPSSSGTCPSRGWSSPSLLWWY